MKRTLIASMAGLATGITTYCLTKKLRKPTPASTFEWISAEDEETEPLPMFYEGDELHLFNPYMGAMYSDTDVGAPSTYVVKDVRYDDQDEVFRYKLEGEDEWVSEDWLSLPMYSKFKRELETEINPMELTINMGELERKILGKALDDSAKQTQVDTLLDRLNWALGNGTGEEISECKRQLQKLTERE